MREIIKGYNGENSKIESNVCRAIFEPKYRPNKKLNSVASPFIIFPDDNVHAELISFQNGVYNKIVLMPIDQVGILISIMGVNEIEAESISADILNVVNPKNSSRISNKKNFSEIDVKIPLDENELFQAGKNNKLLEYYLHNFGNIVRLEKTKKRYVIRNPWNHLGYYRSNSKLLPREIVPYDQDQLGYYFYFQSGGKIQRLFIPKAQNLLYILIEYPAPIRLYRIRPKKLTRLYSGYNFYSEKIMIFGFYPKFIKAIKDIKPASKYLSINIWKGLTNVFNYSRRAVKYLGLKTKRTASMVSFYRITHLRNSWFEVDRLLEINNKNLRDYGKEFGAQFLDLWSESSVMINHTSKLVTTTIITNFNNQLKIIWKKISLHIPKSNIKLIQFLDTSIQSLKERRIAIKLKKG